jgi:2,4-dienoyl-CoA reductase-like NADH-dependent reductase (Old Yellow Enzyme family)
MAAGSMRTPNDALKANELGLPLIAMGHALIMNPNWVELVASGREDEIDTVLKTSKLDQLDIPEKLWNVIQATTGWFAIETTDKVSK